MYFYQSRYIGIITYRIFTLLVLFRYTPTYIFTGRIFTLVLLIWREWKKSDYVFTLSKSKLKYRNLDNCKMLLQQAKKIKSNLVITVKYFWDESEFSFIKNHYMKI